MSTTAIEVKQEQMIPEEVKKFIALQTDDAELDKEEAQLTAFQLKVSLLLLQSKLWIGTQR